MWIRFSSISASSAPSAFAPEVYACTQGEALRISACASRAACATAPSPSSLATPERGHGDVSLLLLDAGVADHPGPTLRLFLLEPSHFRRAAATGQKTQLPVSFLDLRLVERRVNGPVELGNDGSRCFRWRADGVPGIRKEPRDTRFDHGGNVGQVVEPTLGCDREDPGLSPGVELVGRGKFRDHAIHLPADEVVKRRTRAAIGDMHHPGAEQL